MIRGWCPTVHEPMASGDGLLVRIKPPGGRLTSDGARRIAAATRSFGNGIVELTGRGNFQVRGLATGDAAPFAAAMVGADLADADADAERRRNVLVSPLAGDDPTVAHETVWLAGRIERMLADGRDLGRLPAKFCVAVDGGGVLPLRFAADIVVDLAAGAPRITTRPAGRRIGAPPPVVGTAGFHPYPGTARGAFGLGLPFGQTDGQTLTTLADLADEFGDGVLRMSPWRALLLGAVRARDSGRLQVTAEAAGLIGRPDDRRLRIFACIGSNGCARGSVPSRADAVRLSRADFAGTLHVSGCEKGCAHPHPAAITLVGDAGRYRVVRDGRAS